MTRNHKHISPTLTCLLWTLNHNIAWTVWGHKFLRLLPNVKAENKGFAQKNSLYYPVFILMLNVILCVTHTSGRIHWMGHILFHFWAYKMYMEWNHPMQTNVFLVPVLDEAESTTWRDNTRTHLTHTCCSNFLQSRADVTRTKYFSVHIFRYIIIMSYVYHRVWSPKRQGIIIKGTYHIKRGWNGRFGEIKINILFTIKKTTIKWF